MTPEVITAILALVGSGLGSLAGIFLNHKLITYRLEQLEKKVEKHNNLVERMTIVEQKLKERTE